VDFFYTVSLKLYYTMFQLKNCRCYQPFGSILGSPGALIVAAFDFLLVIGVANEGHINPDTAFQIPVTYLSTLSLFLIEVCENSKTQKMEKVEKIVVPSRGQGNYF
jgi:hypothetical protein